MKLIVMSLIIAVVVVVLKHLQDKSSTSGLNNPPVNGLVSGSVTSGSNNPLVSGSVRMPSDHHVAWMDCRSKGDRGSDSLLDKPDEDGYKEAWKECRDAL